MEVLQKLIQALHLYNELKSNIIHLSCLYLKGASEGTSYATQDVPQNDRSIGLGNGAERRTTGTKVEEDGGNKGGRG